MSKGSVIPDDTIIASNSLVNKDFSCIDPFSFLAGTPVIVKATGLKRIFDNDRQSELDILFHYHRAHL